MKPLIVAVLCAAVIAPASAQVKPSCYDTGNGPIQTCIDTGVQVRTSRPFTYRDGQRYSWDHQLRTYCYRNEYGNPHCIQATLIKHLRCTEQNPGQLVCE
ncbi:MAG: hypothetical protein HY527_15415 [Betaproteobacteria bacterium]|nr:hypothetical protein [Betaproteobacteria bacterium]